jgi:hypothetical protein
LSTWAAFDLRHMQPFVFLLLYLRLMGRAQKENWNPGYLVTAVFTMSVNSIDASGTSLHPVLIIAFAFLRVLSYCFCCTCRWFCMVSIKHNARPINHRLSSEVQSMVSDEALKASALQEEASFEVTSS